MTDKPDIAASQPNASSRPNMASPVNAAVAAVNQPSGMAEAAKADKPALDAAAGPKV
jgi:hypothetical protein